MSPGPSILRPERAAHATIRGYLYQACLGVQRWLELGPEEVLLCEGDEATSLNNLGNRLSVLGRWEEALRAKEEAIRTLSPFFVRYPDAFFPWMEIFVRTYLEILDKLGREPDEQLLSPIVALLSERLADTSSE